MQSINATYNVAIPINVTLLFTHFSYTIIHISVYNNSRSYRYNFLPEVLAFLLSIIVVFKTTKPYIPKLKVTYKRLKLR